MKKFFGIMVVCCLAVSLQAQTADEILDQYFENIGGVEAWQNLNSMSMEGTSSMQGMEFPIKVYSKRPNMEKVEISAQGMNIVQAFDGETAWAINPFAGSTEPAKAGADETAEAAKRTFEDDFINYQDKGHTVELLGKEEIEGTETFKIKLTKENGDEEIYFFDTENYVPIMMRSFAAVGPMKGQSVETFLSDYEEHEGLMVPMSIEQKIGGQTVMQGTMTSVVLNGDISDDIFAFPAAEQQADEEEKMKEAEPKEMEEKVKESGKKAMEVGESKAKEKMKESGKKTMDKGKSKAKKKAKEKSNK